MDLSLSEEQGMVQQTARDFATKEVAPRRQGAGQVRPAVAEQIW